MTTAIHERTEPATQIQAQNPAEPRAPGVPEGSTHPGAAEGPTARLKVRVIGKSSRVPIAGAIVSLLPTVAEEDTLAPGVIQAFSMSRLNELTTTVGGLVDVEAPANVDMQVWAEVEDRTAGPATASVSALAVGEQRELVLELPDGNDAQVFGRVLDAETHAAVEGARVRLVATRADLDNGERKDASMELGACVTDSNGRFSFDYPAWREPHLRMEARGYGLKLSEPLKECVDADHPLVVELSRSGSLHARVLDAEGRPLESVLVELVAEGTSLIPEEQQNRGDIRATLPDERWHARSGPHGEFTILDLPSQTRMTAYVNANGKIVRPEGNGFELVAGETKDIEWRIGGICRLRGVVVDQTGKPAPGLRLWLVRSWTEGVPFAAHAGGSWLEQVGDSDGDGRFEFAGIQPGEWFLGPAPDDSESAGARPDSIAPIPERFSVGSKRDDEVTLHVVRGLFIRGRVLDPDGKPCGRMQVLVDDDNHRCLRIDGSDGNGNFTVGPLGRQTVLLSANGGSRFVSSPQVPARAGDSGVELRLRAGGKIRGRVIDARTGAGCSSTLEFTTESDGPLGREASNNGGSGDDGEFESPPSPSGTYSISAITDDGRWAVVRHIDVTTGAVHPDVLLRVTAGGRLRLLHSGTKRELWAQVTLDGARVGESAWLAPGKPRTVPVPAGRFTLELRTREDVLASSRTIELAAGETKELTLTDED